MRQKNQIELNLGTGTRGEALNAAAQETEARAAKACLERPAVAGPSMEAVVERENLKKALAQVKRNKDAAGIDGMSVDDLPAYMKEHWPTIRVQLLAGTYKPQPVRRVEIPKASAGGDAGAASGLGWNVLRDELRLPAGALGASGGGTGAGVYRGRPQLCGGIDLEKFFDRVNHDILMGLIANRRAVAGFADARQCPGGIVQRTSFDFLRAARRRVGSPRQL